MDWEEKQSKDKGQIERKNWARMDEEDKLSMDELEGET